MREGGLSGAGEREPEKEAGKEDTQGGDYIPGLGAGTRGNWGSWGRRNTRRWARGNTGTRWRGKLCKLHVGFSYGLTDHPQCLVCIGSGHKLVIQELKDRF